jgi:TIR domain
MQSTKAIEVLYCCSDSDRDEELRHKLEKHLRLLERQNVIATWHKGMIGAGKEWESEIDTRLNTADIILILISSDLIYSDYHWEVLVRRAMERHKARQAKVIPVLLSTFDNWKSEFGNLKALPEGERPVTKWRNYDHAFESIARGIREVVKEFTDPTFHVKKSFRQISAGARPIANAFVNMASVTLSSWTRASTGGLRSRRQKATGLMPLIMNPVVIFFGVLFVVPHLPNFLGISSSETKPNQTIKSTQNANSTGWIWIGVTNNSSGSLSFGERLLKPSNTDLFPSIEPAVVPSPKAVVTVKYEVNFRKDKSLTEQLGKLKPGDKLVILKVEPFVKPSQNSPYTQLRAQVRKCNKDCK